MARVRSSLIVPFPAPANWLSHPYLESISSPPRLVVTHPLPASRGWMTHTARCFTPLFDAHPLPDPNPTLCLRSWRLLRLTAIRGPWRRGPRGRGSFSACPCPACSAESWGRPWACTGGRCGITSTGCSGLPRVEGTGRPRLRITRSASGRRTLPGRWVLSSRCLVCLTA